MGTAASGRRKGRTIFVHARSSSTLLRYRVMRAGSSTSGQCLSADTRTRALLSAIRMALGMDVVLYVTAVSVLSLWQKKVPRISLLYMYVVTYM